MTVWDRLSLGMGRDCPGVPQLGRALRQTKVPFSHPCCSVGRPHDVGRKDNLMMWLFGPAIANKMIAELSAEKGLLTGTFFFSRTSSTRNTKDRLIPTLAYQMVLSILATRSYIVIDDAINQDPAIFKKTLKQIAILSAISRSFLEHKLPLICGMPRCQSARTLKQAF